MGARGAHYDRIPLLLSYRACEAYSTIKTFVPIHDPGRSQGQQGPIPRLEEPDQTAGSEFLGALKVNVLQFREQPDFRIVPSSLRCWRCRCCQGIEEGVGYGALP